MAVRRRIPWRTATRLQWASDITCNLCKTERRHLEIHHINGAPDENRYDNLILLCRNCHSLASTRDLGRSIPPELLRRYKAFWEKIVASRRRNAAAFRLPARTAKPEHAAIRVANQFEKLMCKRDALGVLALFTPPTTPAERTRLEKYILGGDLAPQRFVRLFATRGFGYKVLRFDIRRTEVLSPKAVNVYLEEWLTWWGDGGWDAVPRRRRTVLRVVLFGGKWLVDRYREPAYPFYRHKYGGLGG